MELLTKKEQEKMDEYLSSLNRVEEQVRRNEAWLNVPLKPFSAENIQLDPNPRTVPQDYLRATFDLMVLAFQTDLTRVASYMMAREDGMGFGDSFPKIALGMKKSHHTISHETNWKEWGTFDRWYMEQFTYFIDRLKEVTDESNGRVGYSEYGNLSSRITGVNDHFPAEKGEAMTAVGLLVRMFMGETDPKKSPILKKHGDLMLRTLPEWDPDGFGSDMYYWYYGSYAMYQLGGTHWKKWEAALKKTILENQRKDGDEKGSWDPVGPWGYAGGRVYSTALMALCIEVYFRYGKVAGAR